MADAFDTAEPLSLEPCDASPAAPDQDGICIASPSRVHVNRRFMVCGAMQLRTGEFGLLDPGTEVKLVAVEAREGWMRAGPAFYRIGHEVDRPLVQVPCEIRAISWFNADLFDNLDLPRRPATWVVHAYLGPFVSNAAVVEVFEES